MQCFKKHKEGLSPKIGKDWTVFDIIDVFQLLDPFISVCWDALFQAVSKGQKRETSGLEEAFSN